MSHNCSISWFLHFRKIIEKEEIVKCKNGNEFSNDEKHTMQNYTMIKEKKKKERRKDIKRKY